MNELAPLASTLSLTAKDRVLVAEGDAVSRRSICTSLVDNGFDVVEAQNSSEVLLMNSLHLSSLAIIDPDGLGGNGPDLIRLICDQLALPLIIVSNRGRAINKVIGLELGADDYMCKPIDLDELVARVHAVLRRTRRQRGSVFKAPIAIGGLPKYRFDGWELDSGRRTLASAQSGILDLTSTEIDLLLIFVKNAQVPLSREHIVLQLGKSSDAAIGRSVDVLVSKLRRKLESDGVDIIKTVRGAGYVFTASVVAA